MPTGTYTVFHPTDHIPVGFYLCLNLMRDRSESMRFVGPFKSADHALECHEAWRVRKEDGSVYYESSNGTNGFSGEPTVFRHGFREDTPVRWFNPLDIIDGKVVRSPWGHCIVEAYTSQAISFRQVEPTQPLKDSHV